MHHAEYVTQRLPNAELTVIQGAGHLHTLERWRDFLTTAAAASPASQSERQAATSRE
jgi:pimeloyl-ACP methyl ester carboxylesterase